MTERFCTMYEKCKFMSMDYILALTQASMQSPGTEGQNVRPKQAYYSHIKSSMNTVLFVNATIVFSENLFLVKISNTCSVIIYVKFMS